MKSRPEILTIAGFDPSGGAGILADVKTFEQLKCQGFAVQTANTIQNENVFIEPNWIDSETVVKQVETLTDNHHFKFVKIGLIKDFELMTEILNMKSFEGTKFIWDPVLSSSSGYEFNQDLNDLKKVLQKVFLITPNWNEIRILSSENDSKKGAQTLAALTNVLLKGGHNENDPGKDFFFQEKNVQSFNPKRIKFYSKHGSGCIFSSAITANLARGFSMNRSILNAKRYVERALASNKTLLAYHGS